MKLTDKINAYNIDCMKFMKDKPDNCYELAIVDPPYGININSNIGRRKNDVKKHVKQKWDKEPPKKEYFDLLFRVSKNQIIWGANNFQYLKPSNGWIVWNKMISGTVDFSECELAYCNIKNTIKKYTLRAQSNENYSVKIHPTQKPIQLYKWLLKNYAKPNDKILDTHGGSMSIAIACHYMDFDLDICELDKEYFNSAIKRFKENTRQIEMF